MRQIFTLFKISMPILITLCVLGGVAILLAIFFAVMLLHKKSYFAAAANLRESYKELNNQLTSFCKTNLTRLETLGKHSQTLQNTYDERKKQYDEIYQRKDRAILNSLNSIDELLKDKNFRQVREIERDVEADIQAYARTISSFSADLSTLLQEDTDIHSSAVAVKSKLRQIREFYQGHSMELKGLEDSFEIILQDADNAIEKFNELADCTKYDEAKEVLKELDGILTATVSIMDQLPLLQASVTTVLPNKLDELMNTYQEMLENQYVVEYLDVERKVSDMRHELDLLRSKLAFLDISGVKDEIDALQTEITDINAAFEQEKQAKENFLHSQSYLDESTYSIESSYSRHINNIRKLQSVYLLDQKYVDQMYALKSDVESIGFLKRDLDSYLDTSNRKPYTIIMKKLSEMKSEVTKTNRTMSDYQNYLNSLKVTIDQVFSGLQECFVNLSVRRQKVRLLGVETYRVSTKPKFDRFFDTICEIAKMLEVFPLNVPEIDAKFRSFQSDCKYFLSDIDQNLEYADGAEQGIVYGNFYRIEFNDCDSMLRSAENDYQSGNFKQSFEIVSKVLATWSKLKPAEE